MQGKDRSLSLRMSSNLAYGVCVNLRVQAQDLAGAALRLLGIKSVPRDQGIDLPAVPTSTHLAKITAPDHFDLAGTMEQMDLSPFLARTANRQITMVEEPFTAGLDFEGLPLPILTEDELLNEDWNLEEGGAVLVQGELELPGEEARKRGREEEAEETAVKKARVEEVVAEEETVMEAPGEAEAVEAPGRKRAAPENLVTPSVADLARSRISPPQLQVDQVLDLPQEVAEEQAQDLPEEQAQEVVVPQEQAQEEAVPQEQVQEEVVSQEQAQEVEVPQGQEEVPQDDAAFLQPLVPAAARRPRPGRKGGKLLVDASIQLRHQDIRQMMETGWRRTLRCEHPSQDLVMVQQLKTVKAGHELGEELREWCQGEQRRVQRPRAWEWLEQEVVGEQAEEVAEVVQAEEGAEVVQQLAEMELGPGEGLLPQEAGEGEVMVEAEREGEVGRDVSRNISRNMQGAMGETNERNKSVQSEVNVAAAANILSDISTNVNIAAALDVPEGALDMDTTPAPGGEHVAGIVVDGANTGVGAEVFELPVDQEQQQELPVEQEQQLPIDQEQEPLPDVEIVSVTEGEVTAALQELWAGAGGSCLFQVNYYWACRCLGFNDI